MSSVTNTNGECSAYAKRKIVRSLKKCLIITAVIKIKVFLLLFTMEGPTQAFRNAPFCGVTPFPSISFKKKKISSHSCFSINIIARS